MPKIIWNSNYNYIHFFVNFNKFGYFCRNREKMDILFDKDYLKELYVTGKTRDKKHRYQPQIINRYVRVIDIMMSLPDTLSLMRINSLNYGKLKGDKKGLSSVRVNDQYRIEFEEYIVDGQNVAAICNITELSNHYK